MSTHPYSLAKQLLIEFNVVDDIRVINTGAPDYALMLKLTPGATDKDLVPVRNYLKKHTGITSHHQIITTWEDGPILPPEFSGLNEVELSILENCSGTQADVVAAVHQAFSWIRYVTTHTITGGHVGVKFSTNSPEVSTEQQHRLKLFLKLMFPPNCRVTLFHEPTLAIPQSKTTGFIVHVQNSSHGIVDPELLRLHQQENDILRTAFAANFGYDPTERGSQLFDRAKSRVVLPPIPIAIPFKSLMVLYDTIFYPIPYDFEISICKEATGLETTDFQDLVRHGKVVPIFNGNFSRYKENTVRALLDLGPFISTQYLAVRIAIDWHMHHPFWEIGQSDFRGFIKGIRDIQASFQRNLDRPEFEIINKLMHAWLENEKDAVLGFSTSIYERGAMTPMSYGPGNLFLKLAPVMGRDVDKFQLEIMATGMEISTASALGAACYPYDSKNTLFYEFLANLHHGRQITNLTEFELLSNLETILSGLEIIQPRNMSIGDWSKHLESDSINQVRRDLILTLEGITAEGIREVPAKVERLRELLDGISGSIEATEKKVDRLDILGAAIETTLVSADKSIPYLGWTLGVIVKNLLPGLWQELEQYPIVQAARDSFVALISKNRIHPVRLHRIKNSL